MIGNQVALIRREFWEHRSLYVVPGVLGLVIVLLAVTGQVAVSTANNEVNLALLGAANIGENERRGALSLLLLGPSWLFAMGMWILTIFYTLDSLYAERKDKSILFWRSLPVTDAETIISKLVTATIIIPLITIVFIAITHLLILVATSIWVSAKGADASVIIWQSVPLFDNWSATFIIMVASAIWLSPFVGWFLLVSAYTKRSPILMAFLPIFILPMLEKIIVKSAYLTDALFVRTVEMPIFKHIDIEDLFDDDAMRFAGENGLQFLSMLDVGKFLGSPGMWTGVIVCGLLTTAAIYVRRYKDES